MQGDQCKYDHGTDAVVIEDSTVPAYNPSDPTIGGSKPDLSVPPPGYSEPYVPGKSACFFKISNYNFLFDNF